MSQRLFMPQFGSTMSNKGTSTSDDSESVKADEVNLEVNLGRIRLKNPVLVASGTFGYAREMAEIVDLSKLGGILPKTITAESRPGNSPWRTVETASGLLNSIGLDNDGIDYFISNHWPYLGQIDASVLVSIAGRSVEDFVYLADRINELKNVAAIELNISCPNVSGGVDFGTDPKMCFEVIHRVRKASQFPIVAKLTPNVTRIVDIAKAAEDGGADAVACVNTLLGMGVDWRKRKPLLGNIVGGLSGPAIKPVALRCVYQVAQATSVPIIGIGGISNLDDVMEFLVTGASAIQIGTANYFDPKISELIINELPQALRTLNAVAVSEIVGSLAKR